MIRPRAGRRGGYRWEVAPPWAGAAEAARRARITPLIAQILHNRHVDGPDDIRRFFDPKLTDLHPPELLPGIEAAADRIAKAVRSGDKICIYGDYDVDGMTAVAILFRCLMLHGAEADYYVPHRLEEGYGVNADAMRVIAASGAKLLVTVDCGISAVAELAEAARLGMDVIVTDHHAPPEELPAAVAVVHPALGEGAYPNPNLSGAGVAFKLAWQVAKAICGRQRVDEPMRNFLLEATSLAALGTIADVVPLTGENRVLATYGLQGLAATAHAGIRALLESAGLTGTKLDAQHVGFALGPRLNACGRMGHARLAVELLARADAGRCRRIAEHLERQNNRRREVEREIAAVAIERVERGELPAPADHAVVAAGKDWHAGVVGIVASRVVDRFARPAVIIALDGQMGRGSARSIPGFNMHDALAACADHLESFGGHAMAGGLTVRAEKVEDFARAFAAYAAENLDADLLTPVLRIDAETSLSALSYPVVQRLERLAPFGVGNPRPVVAARGVRILRAPQRMGRAGAAVNFIVAQDAAGVTGRGARMRCVGFGMGHLADELAGVNEVDLAAEPVLNHYNSSTSVELHVKDVRLPQA
ncbi:MAG TPA: single-stranded-DNA-specific exonuclease RecJ [Phycisphaerae bacterium]|nr:single-stranded-DNA-specific exonuclease RecJ [Phycisphaerae bacterium]